MQKYGPNELEEHGGRSTWEILLDQFKNIMLLMLIAVAIISGVLDLLAWQGGDLKPGEVPFKDTIAIMAIVILNGILGYVQESRAEKALAALKKLSSPLVRVIRCSPEKTIISLSQSHPRSQTVGRSSKGISPRRCNAARSGGANSRRWALN